MVVARAGTARQRPRESNHVALSKETSGGLQHNHPWECIDFMEMPNINQTYNAFGLASVSHRFSHSLHRKTASGVQHIGKCYAWLLSKLPQAEGCLLLDPA